MSVSPQMQAVIDIKEQDYNLLYLGYDGKLIAIFVISTPIRPEIHNVLTRLKQLGKQVILLTGDSEERADEFANSFAFDEVRSQLLPKEKYDYVAQLQAQGRRVVMIGDGINDAAALSLADVGIVMRESSDLARQVSDIILLSDDLTTLFDLTTLSQQLQTRLYDAFRFTIGFNSGLIFGGVMNLISNKTAAMLHNSSTVITLLQASTTYRSKD